MVITNYNPSIAWKKANTVATPVKTSTPYFVPSPTGLPVTPSQVQFLSGAKSSSPTPFYPTPTGAPITISAGGGGITPTPLGATTSYTPQIPTTISSKSLSSSSYSSPSLPSYSSYAPSTISSSPGGTSNYSFDMSSLLTPDLAGQGYKIENNQLIAPATSEQKQPELTGMDKWLAKAKSMISEPPNKLDTYKQAEIDLGLQAKRDTFKSITQQMNAIKIDAQNRLLGLREVGMKEGVTEGVYGQQEVSINRVATMKLLPLAMELSAAQGDLKMAEDQLSTYFKIFSDDVDAQYKYKTDLLEWAYNAADKEDQRTLNEINKQQTTNLSLYNAFVSDVRTASSNAISGGNGSLASQIAQLIPNLNPTSKTFYNDLQIANQKFAQLSGQIQPKAKETTANNPLGILDVQRYNELYPDAGVVAGDTEATANTKVNASNSPEAKLRSMVIAAQANKNTYDTVIKEINGDATIKDKATAIKIADEVYGKTATLPSKIETEIASLGTQLNASDKRNLLRQRGYTQSEIANSSVGNFMETAISVVNGIGSFFSGLK